MHKKQVQLDTDYARLTVKKETNVEFLTIMKISKIVTKICVQTNTTVQTIQELQTMPITSTDNMRKVIH